MKFPRSKTYKKLLVTTQENLENKEELKNLKVKVQQLDSSILYWSEQNQKYRGTKYNSYESQVSAANAMFNGTADWGVNQLAALVESRVSFIMPGGFKIIPLLEGSEIEPELRFIDDFLKFNALQKDNIYQFLSEAELDGKVLLKLFFDQKTPYIPRGEFEEETGMSSVRYISQASNPYKIITNEDDYMQILNATYKDSKSKTVVIPEKDLVYRKFGGRLDQVNVTSSKILKVLTQIENLDKALRNWREINDLFSSPIPNMTVGSLKEAEDAQTAFDKSNWKPGQALFGTGEFKYVQPTVAGAEMLYKEIVVLAEMLSFNTGVPVHYWFPELATNRATAEDISYGLINSATSRERKIWEGLLEELINKGIKLYNDNAKRAPLKQGVFKVFIPVITKEDWERFAETWIPLRAMKAITQRTFLSNAPFDIDIDEEIKALDAEKLDAFNDMKKNGLFGNNEDGKEDEDED